MGARVNAEKAGAVRLAFQKPPLTVRETRPFKAAYCTGGARCGAAKAPTCEADAKNDCRRHVSETATMWHRRFNIAGGTGVRPSSAALACQDRQRHRCRNIA